MRTMWILLAGFLLCSHLSADDDLSKAWSALRAMRDASREENHARFTSCYARAMQATAVLRSSAATNAALRGMIAEEALAHMLPVAASRGTTCYAFALADILRDVDTRAHLEFITALCDRSDGMNPSLPCLLGYAAYYRKEGLMKNLDVPFTNLFFKAAQSNNQSVRLAALTGLIDCDAQRQPPWCGEVWRHFRREIKTASPVYKGYLLMLLTQLGTGTNDYIEYLEESINATNTILAVWRLSYAEKLAELVPAASNKYLTIKAAYDRESAEGQKKWEDFLKTNPQYTP